MSTHTPGPWKAILHGDEEFPFPLSIHTADGAHWIARGGTTSSLANAHLIAAAPDLLEALREMMAAQLTGDVSGHAYTRAMAAAAIAKATGEQP